MTFAWVEADQNTGSKNVPPKIVKSTWSWNSSNEGSILFSVKETSDGGYIAVGNARSAGTPGKPHGVYLIKFNKDGVKVWDKWWGDTKADGISSIGYDVIESDDGSYVLTGKIVPPSEHFDRLLVMKVDSKGALVWQKMIVSPLGSGHYGECGFAIQKTPDGGYIVAGFNQRNYEIPVGREGSTFFPYVLKLDNNGNILWEKFFWEQNPPSGSLNSKGVYVFTDEKRVNRLSASSYSRDYEARLVRAKTGGFFLAFTIELDIRGDNDMFRVLRLDENGNVIWEKSLHEEIGLEAFVAGISATSDDGVAITGFTNTKSLKQRGEYYVGYLVKFDAAGNRQWKKYFGIGVSPTATNIGINPNSIQQTADGGYIVSGYTGNMGLMIARFDADGKILWDRIIEGKENFSYCTRQTSDGGYITAGSKFRPRFKTYSAFAVLLKLDAAGNMSEKYTSGKIQIVE